MFLKKSPVRLGLAGIALALGLSGAAFAAPGGGQGGPPGQGAPAGLSQQCREARFKEILAKYDTNKDGQLEPVEREAMRADREKRWADLMAQYDTNKDGKLDENERKALDAALVKEHFDRMDLNHDGVITLDEAKASCTPLETFFADADTNKDGKVTLAELQAFHDTHRGMMRGFGRHGMHGRGMHGGFGPGGGPGPGYGPGGPGPNDDSGGPDGQ